MNAFDMTFKFFVILFIFLFIFFTLYFCNKTIKETYKTGFEKFKTIFVYCYVCISMCLFILFIFINVSISVIIFLHLFLINTIYNIKNNYSSLFYWDLLFILITGLILSFLYLFNIESYRNFYWIMISLFIFVLPYLSYVERKKTIVRKIKNCTQEVDAIVIKYYKTFRKNHSIYIPVLEFCLNNKNFRYMYSNEIYFYKEPKIGDKIKLFVNPNIKNIVKNQKCDDIFFPMPSQEKNIPFALLFWYSPFILVLILFLLSYLGLF